MNALEALLAALEGEADHIEPHPALVAAQRPTSAQMAMVAAQYGWLPDREEPWLRPAVCAPPARLYSSGSSSRRGLT